MPIVARFRQAAADDPATARAAPGFGVGVRGLVRRPHRHSCRRAAGERRNGVLLNRAICQWPTLAPPYSLRASGSALLTLQPRSFGKQAGSDHLDELPRDDEKKNGSYDHHQKGQRQRSLLCHA